MFSLFKWFLWLAMPFTWALIVLIAVAIVLWKKKNKRWAIPATIVAGLTLLLSLPLFSRTIGYSLESEFPAQPLHKIPTADAIVILGGGILQTTDGVPYPDCCPAADRVIMAARLFHAGKAPFIIPAGETSANAERPLLETMKVPQQCILCDTKSRDTAENAQRTVKILRERGCKKVLLVTSSWHMHRALMLYEGCGLEIIPVACDYESTIAREESSRRPLWMELPNAGAFNDSCIYIKEFLGILFYTFKTNSFESEES